MTSNNRALMPDTLRLVALFGIVVVNVQFIAFSVLQDFTVPAGDTVADALTLWLVNGVALMKSYGLFSFMFGVGLGFLMRSAERRGLAFGRLYRNRMIGLLLLGLAHGCLFFPGDILVTYAVAGAILYGFRNWPVRRLVGVGTALLVIQAVITPPLIFIAPATPDDLLQWERAVLTTGGFADAVAFRTASYLIILPSLLLIQGVSALGWFCLGLAAVKAGMIDDADHPLWQRARRQCLLPGLPLSLLGAALWQWGPPAAGVVLTVVVAPITTLGYLGLIALLSRAPGPIMQRALAAGASSLSIYLGQSLVLSTLFSAYGLGLWGEVDRLTAVAIAVVVTLLLILLLSLWRRYFALGPFEWVLRRMTYAGTGAPRCG
ncbi:DUF418 domain-containing protein [Algiphilus sp.]|uniref:DUF418 domain-containing protein n=1 Tax=Algiphilus sp. TaxID=1872431 RepID=UPI003B518FDF